MRQLRNLTYQQASRSRTVGLPPRFVRFSAMTLLDQITDALGASGTLGDLAGTLGASPSDTESLIDAGLPAILGGLGSQSGGDGIGALMGLLSDSGGFVDNIGSFFAQGDKTGLASKLVGSIFGGQRNAVEAHVAQAGGADISMVSRLLPMLAPAVLGMLSKVSGDDDIDAESMSEQLGAFASGGPLGDILSNTSDEDNEGFTQGIASLRQAGGLAALIPASSSVATSTTARATVGATVAGGAVQHLASTNDDDRNRSGLGWLPAILLPIVALIAGLVLWQCTSPANDVDVAAHSSDDSAPSEPAAFEEPALVTVGERLAGIPNLSTVVGLASDLDLVGTLSDADAGPFTIFAPTNMAFEAAGPVLADLDSDQVQTAVTYHVVPGMYTAADLVDGATLETLAGETLIIGEGAVLPGDVKIVLADVDASNGVIHIVNGVLVPDSVLAALAPEPTPEPAPEPVTIASLAAGTPELSSLVTIATDLDLVGTLADPDAGPFTVFAPTNAAFEAASGTLDRLDGNQVAQTVTFHVIDDIVTSADLVPGATFQTLTGEQLVVGADGTINGGIEVKTADIEADNGIVHIIETVLVPPSLSRSLAAADVNALFQLEPIQFATSSADILPASVATLEQAIVTLTSLPAGSTFEVQGHTDSTGDPGSNQILSEQRAASVVAYLIAGGVDADMLVSVGYGETDLKIDPEESAEDFAANRRIEFLDITG